LQEPDVAKPNPLDVIERRLLAVGVAPHLVENLLELSHSDLQVRENLLNMLRNVASPASALAAIATIQTERMRQYREQEGQLRGQQRADAKLSFDRMRTHEVEWRMGQMVGSVNRQSIWGQPAGSMLCTHMAPPVEVSPGVAEYTFQIVFLSPSTQRPSADWSFLGDPNRSDVGAKNVEKQKIAKKHFKEFMARAAPEQRGMFTIGGVLLGELKERSETPPPAPAPEEPRKVAFREFL
jgi:hypothetical protein